MLFIFACDTQVGLAENADQLTAQSHTNLNYLSVLVSVPSIDRVDLDTLSSISADSSAAPHGTAGSGKVVQIVKLEEFKNIYILVPIFNCSYSCVVRG